MRSLCVVGGLACWEQSYNVITQDRAIIELSALIRLDISQIRLYISES